MTKRLMQEYYANLYDEFRRTTFFVTTDIDEAIYLADRILIMTNIPTQVRASLKSIFRDHARSKTSPRVTKPTPSRCKRLACCMKKR